MKTELAKTISTCAIWLAMALIIIFGLSPNNESAFFCFLKTLIVAAGAGVATAAVWCAPKLPEQSSDQLGHDGQAAL